MALKRLFPIVIILCCNAKNTTKTANGNSNSAILVLSTYKPSNKPLIIDLGGNVKNDLTFTYGENTIVHNGCGATLFGEFWYFGGGNSNTQTHKRQVFSRYNSISSLMIISVE